MAQVNYSVSYAWLSNCFFSFPFATSLQEAVTQ